MIGVRGMIGRSRHFQSLFVGSFWFCTFAVEQCRWAGGRFNQVICWGRSTENCCAGCDGVPA